MLDAKALQDLVLDTIERVDADRKAEFVIQAATLSLIIDGGVPHEIAAGRIEQIGSRLPAEYQSEAVLLRLHKMTEFIRAHQPSA